MKPITLAEARSLALSATRAVEEGLRADREQDARAELLTRAHVPCYADSCMDKLKKAATKLAIAQSRVEALRAALEDGFVVACHGPGLQREMAKRLGISDQYVSDIVRGRREISDAVVRKIVEAK